MEVWLNPWLKYITAKPFHNVRKIIVVSTTSRQQLFRVLQLFTSEFLLMRKHWRLKHFYTSACHTAGKRKRKARKSAVSPSIGPWICKLHIADNGIDTYPDNQGAWAPLTCMQVLGKYVANIFHSSSQRKWWDFLFFFPSWRQLHQNNCPKFRLLAYSRCLVELDLEDNLIGDLGGREILRALLQRKEGVRFHLKICWEWPCMQPVLFLTHF